MAQGVAVEFLQILRDDRRAAWRRTGLLAVLAVAWGVAAFLLEASKGLAIHIGAVALGAASGAWAAGRRVDRYEAALTGRWNAWMEQSAEAATVADLETMAEGGKPQRAAVRLTGLVPVAWVVEVALLALAFIEGADLLHALPVLVVNGVLLGAGTAALLRAGLWHRSLRRSLDEMLAEGEIAYWEAP